MQPLATIIEQDETHNTFKLQIPAEYSGLYYELVGLYTRYVADARRLDHPDLSKMERALNSISPTLALIDGANKTPVVRLTSESLEFLLATAYAAAKLSHDKHYVEFAWYLIDNSP